VMMLDEAEVTVPDAVVLADALAGNVWDETLRILSVKPEVADKAVASISPIGMTKAVVEEFVPSQHSRASGVNPQQLLEPPQGV
jgi:hypothetical protein